MISFLVDAAISYLGARRTERLGNNIRTVMGKANNRRRKRAKANKIKQIIKLARKNRKNYAFMQCSSIEELENANSKDW